MTLIMIIGHQGREANKRASASLIFSMPCKGYLPCLASVTCGLAEVTCLPHATICLPRARKLRAVLYMYVSLFVDVSQRPGRAVVALHLCSLVGRLVACSALAPFKTGELSPDLAVGNPAISLSSLSSLRSLSSLCLPVSLLHILRVRGPPSCEILASPSNPKLA